MVKRMLTAIVVLAGIGVAANAYAPNLRINALQKWSDWFGWSEEARNADPVGFANYAEKKLRQDLQTMEQTRRDLTGEITNLANNVREQQTLANSAMELANDFRSVYQSASAADRFPIEVRGAAYTKTQAESQVSILLAQAQGYNKASVDLTKVKEQAEKQLEELTVRISATEAQLESLPAKQKLLEARRLTDAGEAILAQVDQLLDGNEQVIAENPVRTVRELLDAPPETKPEPVSKKKARAFLNESRAVQPASFTGAAGSNAHEQPRLLTLATHGSVFDSNSTRSMTHSRTKTIFQQY